MAIPTASHMACAFGILGNIVSFLVYLAPLAMLLWYYGFLKTNGIMIISINTIGCAIEATYLTLFMLYATKEAKIYTTKLLIFFDVGVYGLIMLCTSLFSHEKMRVTIVGWICTVFSVCVFAAPLSIMTGIRTKSVEYMPFALSFFLTPCAIMWFFYDFLIKDFYIATPNILGFAFGIAQMVLYIIYKDNKNQVLPEVKLQDLATTVINLSTIMEMQEHFKQEEHVVNEEADNKPVEASESNVR